MQEPFPFQCQLLPAFPPPRAASEPLPHALMQTRVCSIPRCWLELFLRVPGLGVVLSIFPFLQRGKPSLAQKKAAAPIAPGSLGADETGWECAGALLTLCAHLLLGVLGLFKPLMGSGIV